jgi:hypothetical protein
VGAAVAADREEEHHRALAADLVAETLKRYGHTHGPETTSGGFSPVLQPRSLAGMTCTVLPRVSFPKLTAPGTISLNQGTRASVVFVPHREPCPACTDYLDVLEAAASGLEEWATRALVMVTGASAGQHRAPAGVVLLDDAGATARARLGVGDDQAAVIQADRWGAVYQAAEVASLSSSHASLPAAHELIALAKLIDIQCPECEVPSKEWMDVSPFPLG